MAPANAGRLLRANPWPAVCDSSLPRYQKQPFYTASIWDWKIGLYVHVIFAPIIQCWRTYSAGLQIHPDDKFKPYLTTPLNDMGLVVYQNPFKCPLDQMHWGKQEKRNTVTMLLSVNYQHLLDFSALPTIRDICASSRLGLLIDDVPMFTADSLNELDGMRDVSSNNELCGC